MSIDRDHPLYDRDHPLYRAGFLDGAASRQAEIDQANADADRYYRAAFDDDRRPVWAALAAVDVRRNRAGSAPERTVTPAEALADWGLEEPPSRLEHDDPSAPPTASIRTTAMSRRRAMSTRTVIGRLAADPIAEQVGKVTIVKLRVIENTGEYRNGEWVPHPTPTTHFVEAKWELGENALASLHTGDQVVVIGAEHTESWEKDGTTRSGRVIEADHIAASLRHATAQITRTARRGDGA